MRKIQILPGLIAGPILGVVLATTVFKPAPGPLLSPSQQAALATEIKTSSEAMEKPAPILSAWGSPVEVNASLDTSGTPTHATIWTERVPARDCNRVAASRQTACLPHGATATMVQPVEFRTRP